MKKLPSISATDLARIAPLAEAQQVAQLQQLKRGFPPFTYKHTRARLPDLLNLEAGPLLPGPSSTWPQIEKALVSACATGDETDYNLMASRAVFEFAQSEGISGRRHTDGFGPMQLGRGFGFALWERAVVNYRSQPHVLFIDLRSTKHLTDAGRRFAFSAQHEQIRERDPDLANVGLLILHVGSPREGRRPVRAYTDVGIELYDYDTLNLMTARTYQLWEEVWSGRIQDVRDRAVGDGPLFG